MHSLIAPTQHRASMRIASVGPAVAFALFILVSTAIVTATLVRNATTDDPPTAAVTERPSYDRYRFVEENTTLPGPAHRVAPQAGGQRSARQEKPVLDFTHEWRHFAKANDITPDDLAMMREPRYLNPSLSRGGLTHA